MLERDVGRGARTQRASSVMVTDLLNDRLRRGLVWGARQGTCMDADRIRPCYLSRGVS